MVVWSLFHEREFSSIVITLLLHGKIVIVIRKLCFLDNTVMMMQRYYTTLYTGEYCLPTFGYDFKQIVCCLRNNSCEHVLLGFLFDIYVFINVSWKVILVLVPVHVKTPNKLWPQWIIWIVICLTVKIQ